MDELKNRNGGVIEKIEREYQTKISRLEAELEAKNELIRNIAKITKVHLAFWRKEG